MATRTGLPAPGASPSLPAFGPAPLRAAGARGWGCLLSPRGASCRKAEALTSRAHGGVSGLRAGAVSPAATLR